MFTDKSRYVEVLLITKVNYSCQVSWQPITARSLQ